MIIKSNFVKKSLDFAGKYLHAPEQRLLLGVTALATQPFIDKHNKNVDESTRKASVARTIAKIIVGTATGVAVRYAGIKFVQHFCQYSTVLNNKGEVVKVIGKKGKDLFVPLFTSAKNQIFPIAAEKLKSRLDLYAKNIGTLLATLVMVYTNFAIDAPGTTWLTGVISKIMKADVPLKKLDKEEGKK